LLLFLLDSCRCYSTELGPAARPQVVGRVGVFNLASCAEVRNGHLFVSAAPSWGQGHVWRRLEHAVAGKPAAVLLGAESFDQRQPQTARNWLSHPSGLSFDGTFLGVGEVKFYERLLRFSPLPWDRRCGTGSQQATLDVRKSRQNAAE
jgi:hypothetical protein